MSSPQAITLSEYTQRISRLFVTAPGLQNVWITAETSDVRLAGGHCYLELVEKDPNGRPLAKLRANIWAQKYYYIADRFMRATGEQLRSDLKVMVYGTAQYHPVFGLSFNITDINAAYTLGDVMQRRIAILNQLKQDGTLDYNRSLPWPAVPSRIAIISAKNAAGYGDFIKHLYSNSSRLRFTTELFTATMQGERTVPSIIAALDTINSQADLWDCVVIIRGGGASTDLLAFDDYALASNISQFPIPVIVGIGHERDTTVLDYVANMRVKTPTAAAAWLIERGEMALGRLQSIATAMLQAVTDRLGGCHRQLSYISGQLPVMALAAIERARARLTSAQVGLLAVSDRRLRPQMMLLDTYKDNLRQAITVALKRAADRLDADAKLIEVLSPEATLKRGYSITRIGGHAICSAAAVAPGTEIETQMADGTILSLAK